MSQKNLLHYELRNGTVETLLFIAKTTDLGALRAEMSRRFGATPGFFANEAVAIDLRRLEDEHIPLDDLISLLTEFQLRPIGVIATDAQRAGLGASTLPLVGAHDLREAKARAKTEETVSENKPEAPKAAPEQVVPAVAAKADTSTMVIDKPLRSGQQVYANADLVILSVVSYGAEVIAGGNIHIYAPLRGRALAGVHGNPDARIFCTCLEPELIAIAGVFRTAENPLPKELLGKPVQIRLDDEKLIFEPLNLS
jgi:septum site-determining protein MinC